MTLAVLKTILCRKRYLLGIGCLTNRNNLSLSSEDYNALLEAQRFMFELARKAGELASHFDHPVPNTNSNSFNGLIIAGENTKEEEVNAFHISNVSQQANEINTDIPANYTGQKLLNSLL